MAPKSVPVPMITRVRLKNFRSIAECDVELGPLTILVGPNGSGKSNFLHALDFVADALNDGLETAVRRRGGMNSLLSRWALDDSDATLEIELELDLPEDRHGVYALSLKRTTAGGYKIAKESALVTKSSSWDVYRRFHVGESGSTTWVGTEDAFYPRLAIDPLQGRALTLTHAAGDATYRLLYESLRGMACYTLHVSEMRKPLEPDGGVQLRPDGANVASVMERMTDKNDHGWSPALHVADWLAVIAPGIVAVRSTSVAGYLALQFDQRPDEESEPWTFTAGEMSYGTLRTLGVLVALYQGSMKGGSPVTLVGIEEPESSVHPGAATAILEAMDEASLTTQVLVTTQSSTMLDHEDLDMDILRAVAPNEGRTVIGRIDAVSRSMMRQRLYTGGELLRMGQLEPDSPDVSPSQSLVAAHPS